MVYGKLTSLYTGVASPFGSYNFVVQCGALTDWAKVPREPNTP